MNQAIRRTLIIAGVIVGGFLTIRLLDLLMVWSLYSWFFQTIRNASGMPDSLNGAFSIWLVAITLMLLPTFISVVFWKRSPKKVFIVVGAVSAWLLISYFMSLPKEGRFFNPMTGQPMYRYARTSDGRIDLFPLGYSFHPKYGTKLKMVTPELIEEMDRKVEEKKVAEEREKERQRQATENALKLAQQEQELAQKRAQAKEQEEREAQSKLQLKYREQELARERERKRERRKQETKKEEPDPIAAIAKGYIDRGLAAQRGEQNNRAQEERRAQSYTTTKVLVLRFDGFTPCSPVFDYPFELDTQGDPISLYFPGASIEPKIYSGKGKMNIPWRSPGPVPIRSLNPNKQVRVRIWEIVTVQGIQ